MDIQYKQDECIFRGEVDKFIKVAESHARKEKIRFIYYPCKAWSNFRFIDPTTIRSHVVLSDFVKEYTIQKKQGEMDASPPKNNSMDQIIQDEEFHRMFDAYYDGGGDDDGIDVDDGVGVVELPNLSWLKSAMSLFLQR